MYQFLHIFRDRHRRQRKRTFQNHFIAHQQTPLWRYVKYSEINSMLNKGSLGIQLSEYSSSEEPEEPETPDKTCIFKVNLHYR